MIKNFFLTQTGTTTPGPSEPKRNEWRRGGVYNIL